MSGVWHYDDKSYESHKENGNVVKIVSDYILILLLYESHKENGNLRKKLKEYSMQLLESHKENGNATLTRTSAVDFEILENLIRRTATIDSPTPKMFTLLYRNLIRRTATLSELGLLP